MIKLQVVPTILMVFALPALAQRPGRMPHYDPATEVRVKGTVTEVQQVGRSGRWMGMHLILKTDSETFDVHLGPAAFLAQNQMSFSKGDAVEVLGSKVGTNGGAALVAREVQKDGKTLTLRDANGIPRWSRGRRGQT